MSAANARNEEAESTSSPSVYRVLSIDGGGARGLIPLYVLRIMERALRMVDPSFAVHEAFDMYCGTSVGGIIAIGLGVAQKSIEDVSNTMNCDAMCDIFAKSYWDKVLGRVQTKPKYDGEEKTRILREAFGNARFSDGKKLVVIPVYDIGCPETGIAPHTCFFVNHVQRCRTDTATVPYAWSVADATSAAPTYFPSVSFSGACAHLPDCTYALSISAIDAADGGGDDDRSARWRRRAHKLANKPARIHTFIDGGVAVNNPSTVAAAIAKRLVRHGKSHTCQSDSKCGVRIISIGTGITEIPLTADDTRGWGTIQWLNNGLLDVIQDTTVMDGMCEIMLDDDDDGRNKNYVRINSPLCGTGVLDAMDETTTENFDAMKRLAHVWWRTHCREVFEFFNLPFVPEAENVSLP